MLSFEFDLADVAGTGSRWSWDGDRWVHRRSWVRPFTHPAVEVVLRCDGSGACLVVRERRAGQPPVPERGRALASAASWRGDFTVLDVAPGRLRVVAGPGGTAPLYLAAAGPVLAGSWDVTDLRRFVDIGLLCGRSVARALTRQHRYSSDTLFAGVHQLTERATATFSGGRCRITYPQPAAHVLSARSLRCGVDAVDALDHVLERATGELAAPPGAVGVELSGGADSANVALTLAALHGCDAVHSFGLVLDDAQRHRRAALARTLRLRDVALDAYAHPPFAPHGVRGRAEPHDPRGAYYQEAFDALRRTAVGAGVCVMFTGIGGDEAMAPHPDEVEPPEPTTDELPAWLGPATREAIAGLDDNLAPVPQRPLPTLLACALHNPGYLSAGIWPVAPFADPLVTRFLRQLPRRWREHKGVLRERLRRAGFTTDITDPFRPESFGNLMDHGLRRHGLPLLDAMTHDSLLVDAGYLDGDRLRRTVTRAAATGHVPSRLTDALALEVGLRSLAA